MKKLYIIGSAFWLAILFGAINNNETLWLAVIAICHLSLIVVLIPFSDDSSNFWSHVPTALKLWLCFPGICVLSIPKFFSFIYRLPTHWGEAKKENRETSI